MPVKKLITRVWNVAVSGLSLIFPVPGSTTTIKQPTVSPIFQSAVARDAIIKIDIRFPREEEQLTSVALPEVRHPHGTIAHKSDDGAAVETTSAYLKRPEAAECLLHCDGRHELLICTQAFWI